jgi:hypothetical protein
MFISDSFHAYMTEVKKSFKAKIRIIPGRLLSLLQYTAVCINWSFKAKLEENYIQWMAMREQKFASIMKIKLQKLNSLACALKMQEHIFHPLISRSLKKCGISHEPDGMEDNCLWDSDPDHMNSVNDKSRGRGYMWSIAYLALA